MNWVEYLRATGSPADVALTDAVRASDDIGVPAASPADHETAAALYGAARRTGATVRSLLDCLVAAAALRTDSVLLARDRDFEVIAG